MPSTGRAQNGWRRRQVVSWLRSSGDHICHICGNPIDMSLKYPDPWSWSCDELLPVSRGGSPYDRDNVAEAHLVCNERRGNRMPNDMTARQLPVHRTRDW